jgi:dipeptidyl aminopeptidase/acylaminoacyl peptidase
MEPENGMTRYATIPGRFLALALLPAALAVAPAPGASQGLTPEQVVSLRSVTSAALSPDGQWVAYTVTRPRDDVETRGPAYSELFLVPARGGESRAIVERPASATSPAWSPDGGTLAFAATLPMHDQRQVYGVSPEGGDPRPLTTSPVGVGAFAFSPDGGRIAYTETVPEADSIAERRAGQNDVIVMSEQGRRARLWVKPLDGRGVGVTPPDRDVRAFTWAPDGSWLAVQVTDQPGADADLMFRELHSVAADGSWMRELVETEGKLGPMAFSPDGRTFAWLGATQFNDPLAQSVFVAPVAGGTVTGAARNLTDEMEASVMDLGWLDGRTLWFVAAEGTRSVLYRSRADGSGRERIAGGGAQVFNGASFDGRTRTFAVAASTAEHPAEVWVGSPGGSLRRVTTHNGWLRGVALGEQSTIEWTGPEGLRIEGVLIRPAGYREGQRYPLAILPHGGPEGISADGWTTNPLYPAQVLAGAGYAVLMPNYRGSGGRGVVFSKGDHRDLGGREMQDVLAGIDHLDDLGLVDPDRVGISGTSYGGYLSAWAATRHSDRFRVALPFAGLTNWVSFTGTTDIPVEMSDVHFDLPLFGNEGLYMDRSPVSHIEGARTPTHIGHGLADDRVHPEQSIQLYTLMRLHGTEVELVLYPREPHGLRERAHQLDYMRRVLDWMDRYLKVGVPVT